MNLPILSKSSFIRGLQCHKSLWLHLNQPDERDDISVQQQLIFDTGHSVGFLAQQRFPGGIDASRGDHADVAGAIAYTQELIALGQPVIYEAAFGDGETLCYMDILVHEPDGWAAYEVKASTRVKEYQINDVAFQYAVITRSGLPLKRISLVHLNNQYIRRGDLDLTQLFTVEPMTARILPMQDRIAGSLRGMQQMLATGAIPAIGMGPHCRRPFTCDFWDYCMREIPVETDCRPSPAFPAANRNAETDGSPSLPVAPIHNQPALDQFTANLNHPLYFIDFETIQFAVPRYDESRPYQQIPFQWSVHLQQTPNGPLEHFEFLGTPPEDPRPQFIRSLLACLNETGTIIVWNQAFECTRLREIARDFPEFRDPIDRLLPRIADLMVPFRRKVQTAGRPSLHTPEMNGSYSLKAVLPALVPDLSYEDLEIREGGMASMVYESLYSDTDSNSIISKRESLLKYCCMDTRATVEILMKISTGN